jgi:diacylglycerol O-acyltransferase / wax synthase
MASAARAAPGAAAARGASVAGPERLSAADASNVEIDSPDQVNAFMLVGVLGTGGFVAGTDHVDLGRLREAVAERIGEAARPGLERFAQRVGLEHRPLVWQPCVPDLAWHIRLTDPVAGRQGLSGLAARLMTEPLPLDRPLWELLVVPGASEGGVGVILRLHHCVSDGVGAIRLVQQLFGEPVTASARVASRAPAAEARRNVLRTVFHGTRRMVAVLRARIPPTVLLGPIGARRGVGLVDVELAALSAAARRRGATVNDALLAAAAVAVESALRADAQPVPEVLPASVPVALPDRGSSGNAVGVMLVPLPLGEPDPEARLSRIAASTRQAKDVARAQGTLEITRTRWGARLFARLARRQRLVALFVTNVRGPTERLLVAGAPLERAWPVAPIQGNVRLGIAAMSYAGRLGVAIHADGEAIRVDVAREALARELARIAALPAE